MKFPSPQIYRAKILGIHDGDTVKVLLDRGFEEYSSEWIRLSEVFAPELKQKGGAATRDFVEDWVKQREDDEWPFRVVIFRQKNDSKEQTTLSRYVARIFYEETNQCLNDDVASFVAEQGFPRGTGGLNV